MDIPSSLEQLLNCSCLQGLFIEPYLEPHGHQISHALSHSLNLLIIPSGWSDLSASLFKLPYISQSFLPQSSPTIAQDLLVTISYWVHPVLIMLAFCTSSLHTACTGFIGSFYLISQQNTWRLVILYTQRVFISWVRKHWVLWRFLVSRSFLSSKILCEFQLPRKCSLSVGKLFFFI